MLYNLWNSLLYKPLINILAVLSSIVPGADIGVAIILLTIIVKVVLYPLSKASIKNQQKISQLTPELNKIKKSDKSKEDQAKETFELYKKHGTNPFSGCLLILIQIPIIFALYRVFLKGLSFDPETLYSFVHAPMHANMVFLGIIDISQKSLVLAILAGITQYLQAHFMPKTPQTGEPGSFSESFQKSMQTQMKYFFPFLVAFIAYSISGAVALYWITNNIFTTLQQIYIKKQGDKEQKQNETRNNQ